MAGNLKGETMTEKTEEKELQEALALHAKRLVSSCLDLKQLDISDREKATTEQETLDMIYTYLHALLCPNESARDKFLEGIDFIYGAGIKAMPTPKLANEIKRIIVTAEEQEGSIQHCRLPAQGT